MGTCAPELNENKRCYYSHGVVCLFFFFFLSTYFVQTRIRVKVNGNFLNSISTQLVVRQERQTFQFPSETSYTPFLRTLAVLNTTARRQIQALESRQRRWMGGQLGAQPCVSKCQWFDLQSPASQGRS